MDAEVGFLSKFNMMNPMSCTLSITRNLSYTWYRDVPELNLSGRLKSIEVNKIYSYRFQLQLRRLYLLLQLTLFADDYALVMLVLNRNLNEGLEEFPPSEEAPQEAQVRPERRNSRAGRLSRTVQVSPIREKIHESIKFNFQFDGVVINLMEGK